MTDGKLRIFIADDEELLLESLSIILSVEPDFLVAGTARDGAAALAGMKTAPVDIVLLDLQMPGMSGLQFIPRAREVFPGIKILILTTFHDDKNIAEAIRLGADGYLLKDAGRDAIVRSIRQIDLGQGVIDSRVMAVLSRSLRDAETSAGARAGAENPLPERPVAGLTARESEICRLMADGHTNSQIASILYLSEGTIKNYVMTIYEKTGIRDRVKLALYYKNAAQKTP